jgi:hypothetical protein
MNGIKIEDYEPHIDALHGALATRVFAFCASVFVRRYYESYPIRRNRGRASVL